MTLKEYLEKEKNNPINIYNEDYVEQIIQNKPKRKDGMNKYFKKIKAAHEKVNKVKKKQQVINHWNNGERNFSEIARKVGTTRQYVHTILHKLGHKGSGKIPNRLELVKKIKHLAENGLTAAEILKEVNIKKTTLNNLKAKYKILITDGHTKYKKDFLLKLYFDNERNYATMAEKLGVKTPCIYRMMETNELKKLYPNQRKKRGKNQKVDQVDSGT